MLMLDPDACIYLVNERDQALRAKIATHAPVILSPTLRACLERWATCSEKIAADPLQGQRDQGCGFQLDKI